MMQIKPLEKEIFVTSPLTPNLELLNAELEKVLQSGVISNFGQKHNELENKLKDYLKVPNLALFNNGTTALFSAIKCLGIKGEIITTPFTFPAVINSIICSGLTPVFCDIDENYNINPDLIESCITSETSAILAVHTFGIPCNYKRIDEIAQKYNLKVIYDAAHAFGVEVDEKPIGSLGDVSMFSFHATKVYNTIEGGALVCQDKNLYEKIKLFRNFGIDGEDVLCAGLNGKLNEIQAAVGLLNLPLVEDEIEKRKKLTELYCEELTGISGISVLKQKNNVKSNYQYLIISVDKNINRDMLFERLKEYNIFTKKYFYPCATDYSYINNTKGFPVAQSASKQTLALPLYGKLSQDDVRKICAIIKFIIK